MDCHKANGNYWVNYIDPDGYPRLSCFAKLTEYDIDALMCTHFSFPMMNRLN